MTSINISKSSASKPWGNQTKNLAVLSSLVMEGEVSLSRDEWCQEFLPPQEETAQSEWTYWEKGRLQLVI